VSATIKVTGLKEVSKALKALGGRQALYAIGDATKPAAREIAKQLKRDAPKNTGELKRSIRAGKIWRGRRATGTGVKMKFYGYILSHGEDSKRGRSFGFLKDWIPDAVMRAYRPSVDKFTNESWKQIVKQWKRYVKTRRV